MILATKSIMAGREAGSGKSHYLAQKILIKACNSRRKVLIVRKVAATLHDSVWQLFIDILTQWKIATYCKVNLSTLTITLPNNSVLLFKGCDDPEKIKSITGITDIWAEEATELSENDFTQLDLRLRTRVQNLQFFLSFNPVSRVNWCYKHWFEHGAPDNARVVKTTYKDNKFLSADYVASLEKMQELNPTYYRIYALGEFCSLDRLVYNNWEISTDEPPTDSKLIVGLDFGYINDPSALVMARVDEVLKIIYITDTVSKKGMLNDEIAALIKYKGLAKEVIIADSAEQKSIEEIKRLGVPRIRPAAKGQGSINQGIQHLQQYKIKVNPKCEDIITEFQNYSYKKDKLTNEYTNEPNDCYNHCLDALRYAMQCIEKQSRLQSLSKAALGL